MEPIIETVFKVEVENQIIEIVRIIELNRVIFNYTHNGDVEIDNEDLVSKNDVYNDFATPFKLINDKYKLYKYKIDILSVDYRLDVLSQLLNKFNKIRYNIDEFEGYKSNIEKILGVKILFGNIPEELCLYNITIRHVKGKEIEKDYGDLSGQYYTDSEKLDVLKNYKDTEELNYTEYRCVGKINILGSTIIVKNEFNHILYVFSSSNAFIKTEPVLRNCIGWYYK